MAISTNGTVLTRLAGALYNTQMSNATYAELVGTAPATVAANMLTNDFAGKTDAQLATIILTNLGLTSITGLDNWLAAQLTAAGSTAAAKGAALVTILNGYANMTTDATYGSYATSFKSKVDASLAKSQTVGNTGGTFSTSDIVAITDKTITLTTGLDSGASFTGGSGNDAFNATHLTFNASDVLVGGTGTDTLTIVDSGATALTVPAANVSGVENITIRNLNTSPAVAEVTAVNAVAAVRQVQTITSTVVAADKANALTVAYGPVSVTTAATDGSATAVEVATLITGAINAIAGSTVATVVGSIAVVTAPVAGTALPTITVTTTAGNGAAGNITHVIADAQANVAPVAAVTGVTAVTAAAAQTMSVTASNFVGATAFTSESSTGLLSLSALSSTQTANLIAGSGGITAGYGATVTAGTVNVSGGTTAGAVAINGAALRTLNLSSTGATNTLGAISSDSAVVSAVNLSADSAILTSGLTVANAGAIPAVALTISGAAGDRAASSTAAPRSAVTLGSLDTDFTTINASGLTAGGVSATLSATTTATFTGGSGSDRITTSTSGQLGAINAGAGTDTLILADTTHMDTAAEGAIYTGFEVLSVANNVSIDMDTFTGSTITAVAIADAANATSVTDMSATQAANVTIAAGAGALTLGVKDATTVGTQNTLNLTVSDGDTTTSEAVWGTGDVTLAGVETINITATDDVTWATLANISGLGTLTVSGSGDVSLTTGAQALTNNAVFNASGVTGTVVIDAGSATGFGVAITGSATNTNTLTGTALGDVITGGANVDTIATRVTGGSGTGGDTITTGGGFDTVTIIGAVAAASSTNYDAAPRIADFTVGTAANNTDLIRFENANTDYLQVGAAAGLAVTATAEGADGAVGVQTVAQNAGAAAGATGAEFIKLTTGVAFTTSIQGTFNLAIGTSTVTTLAQDGVYAVSYYDTTNSRMVILGVDITAGTNTTLETGDVVTLIGTINMSAADYALIDADNFGAFV